MYDRGLAGDGDESNESNHLPTLAVEGRQWLQCISRLGWGPRVAGLHHPSVSAHWGLGRASW
jgi:hypothetical protein